MAIGTAGGSLDVSLGDSGEGLGVTPPGAETFIAGKVDETLTGSKTDSEDLKTKDESTDGVLEDTPESGAPADPEPKPTEEPDLKDKEKATDKEEISTLAKDLIDFHTKEIYTNEYRKQPTKEGRQAILNDPEKNVLVSLHFIRNYPSDLSFPEEYTEGIPITVEGKPIILTDSQKVVLTAHLDSLKGKEFPQGDELKELTKDVETATQELIKAKKDTEIPTPLEEILVLSGLQKIQKELKEYIQNLTLEYESQTDPTARKRILQTINLAQEDYRENEINLANISRNRNIEPWEKAINEVAEGKNPELEQKIRDALLMPGGVADVIKLVAEQYGIKLDPTMIEKYGKTAGKMSLLAALGLIYALMKSGKEQPQYQ